MNEIPLSDSRCKICGYNGSIILKESGDKVEVSCPQCNTSTGFMDNMESAMSAFKTARTTTPFVANGDKLYVTGDTHSCYDKFDKSHFKPITYLKRKVRFLSERRICKEKRDIMIIAGDFGGIFWREGHKDYIKEEKNNAYLAAKPFTTCFVDGNHENFDVLDKLPTEEKWGAPVGVYVSSEDPTHTKIYHLRRGYVYTILGKKVFTFGGATSIDKCYRTPGQSWWDREMPSYAEYDRAIQNLAKHDFKVDIVVTHHWPQWYIDYFLPTQKFKFEPCPVALFLSKEVLPKLTFDIWVAGHMHIDLKTPIIQEGKGKFWGLYDKTIEV